MTSWQMASIFNFFNTLFPKNWKRHFFNYIKSIYVLADFSQFDIPCVEGTWGNFKLMGRPIIFTNGRKVSMSKIMSNGATLMSTSLRKRWCFGHSSWSLGGNVLLLLPPLFHRACKWLHSARVNIRAKHVLFKCMFLSVESSSTLFPLTVYKD